jgi:hypothetical protein
MTLSKNIFHLTKEEQPQIAWKLGAFYDLLYHFGIERDTIQSLSLAFDLIADIERITPILFNKKPQLAVTKDILSSFIRDRTDEDYKLLSELLTSLYNCYCGKNELAMVKEILFKLILLKKETIDDLDLSYISILKELPEAINIIKKAQDIKEKVSIIDKRRIETFLSLLGNE